jgi:hypothetical protein
VRSGVIISSVVLAAASGARAQPVEQAPAPEDDLGEIEAAIAADTAEPAQPTGPAPAFSFNPDISVVTDIALAWFSEESNLQGGGHDPAANGFTLQGVELAIGKAVDPYFRFDAAFAFGAEGFELEEAYATTLDLPHNLQARAGQFLTRFGRINPTHLHAWDFVDQPFMLTRIFGSEGNRAPGFELSWLAPTDWYTEVFASATRASGEGSTRSFLGETDDPIDSPLELQTTIGLRQFYELSHDLSLATGASYAGGPNPSGDRTRTHVAGIDVYLKYRPITEASYTIVALQTEWSVRRRQLGDVRITDVTGYAYLWWRFAQRWATGARYEYGSPAKDGDGMTGLDDLDPDWTSGRHRVTAALTFAPTEFSRLRLQGSVDRPGWLDDPIYAGFLNLEVTAGAHGAHKF